MDKNEKLVKKISGQLLIQGARLLILDMIIAEAVKIVPYLNYIQEKEMVINASKEICTSMKEALNKNPVDTTKNTINFLNKQYEDYLRTMGIKGRIVLITWARKVVGKHQHIEIVQAKIDIIHHQIKIFKDLFVSFSEGFSFLLERRWKHLSQSEYQALLVKSLLDHKFFEDMTQSLSRKTIIDKLAVYFELINTFKTICT